MSEQTALERFAALQSGDIVPQGVLSAAIRDLCAEVVALRERVTTLEAEGAELREARQRERDYRMEQNERGMYLR